MKKKLTILLKYFSLIKIFDITVFLKINYSYHTIFGAKKKILSKKSFWLLLLSK